MTWNHCRHNLLYTTTYTMSSDEHMDVCDASEFPELNDIPSTTSTPSLDSDSNPYKTTDTLDNAIEHGNIDLANCNLDCDCQLCTPDPNMDWRLSTPQDHLDQQHICRIQALSVEELMKKARRRIPDQMQPRNSFLREFSEEEHILIWRVYLLVFAVTSETKFPCDLQICVALSLLRGADWVVTVGTGSGKTFIAAICALL
ncbi:hypothetical protein BDV98DRAFT_363479 [Pterulicium gracile]|uniref:DEAD/DEAH box helicase domain-containing protein n=1 Tax=Pterulicium gracile TaxID=1884261 RepID=A0A5C3QQA3_9AGAR|nr:hypothetical protein BDV98DRAFT_363479 [Pterula gracilis]